MCWRGYALQSSAFSTLLVSVSFYMFFDLFPSQAADVELPPGAVLRKTVFLIFVFEATKSLRPIFIIICLFFFLFFFLYSQISIPLFIALSLFLVLCNFCDSYHLLLNYIILSLENIFLHLFFCFFTAQKYPMVHLLQKGDSSFNQELLKNMVKSIKMNDVYGPMSQILETLNKCPHFKRQR